MSNSRGVCATNGLKSDGSLMNVGNQIWDPEAGGRPSIKLFPEYSSGHAMRAALALDDDDTEGPSAKAEGDPGRAHVLNPHKEVVSDQPSTSEPASSMRIQTNREQYSGASMATLLGGGDPASQNCDRASTDVSEHSGMEKFTKPPAQMSGFVESESFAQANLYRSAREGNVKLVKLALENDGGQINGQNTKDNLWSALHYASHGGCFRLVQYLLQMQGIDVTLKDCNGSTAADVAKTDDIKELIKGFPTASMP